MRELTPEQLHIALARITRARDNLGLSPQAVARSLATLLGGHNLAHYSRWPRKGVPAPIQHALEATRIAEAMGLAVEVDFRRDGQTSARLRGEGPFDVEVEDLLDQIPARPRVNRTAGTREALEKIVAHMYAAGERPVGTASSQTWPPRVTHQYRALDGTWWYVILDADLARDIPDDAEWLIARPLG